MIISTDSIYVVILWGVVAIFLLIKAYFNYAFTYWEKRRFPYLKPKFPSGNLQTLVNKGIGIGTPSKIYYDALKKKGHKFGGIYGVTQPMLVVNDPDYVRDILTVDFQHFTNRGIYFNEKHDPVSANLFSQDSAEWRQLRIKFTPTFTSGKMKAMFNSVVKCSQYLTKAIGQYAEQNLDVDTHEVAGCFTTDVIGTCAFGIDCNSFKEPNAEFRRMGKRVFEIDFLMSINMFLSINFPKLSRKLGITTTNKDVREFFSRIIKESIKYRENNNVNRIDFLQLLLDLKNKSVSTNKLTEDEIAAQSFLFFVAGFETSSTTMNYTLLELAQNPDVQEKLRKEIRGVLAQHNGEITYDGIAEMKYMMQCVEETLRIYPPVPTLNRVCTKDYQLKGTDLVIEKDMPILISVLGLHRDPDIWPEPLKYDPNRFSEENKKERHQYVHIPFGDGPRNCIGLRFGLMQAKIGLAAILKDYKVTLSPKTKLPIELNPYTFVLFPLNKVYLKFEKLSS